MYIIDSVSADVIAVIDELLPFSSFWINDILFCFPRALKNEKEK
jgi:hypothetical protein